MSRWIVLFFGILASLLVFILQADSTNFRIGHRGWVAAHVLAIADKATPKNHFIGNTCNFETNGVKEYSYFDRYPLFFSAVSSFALSMFDKPSEKILFSRQWMNAIYVLTFIATYFLINLFFSNSLKSLTLTLSIASGFFYVEFKDMFHFDQPALLGLVLFLTTLKLFEHKKVASWVVVAVATIACLMGRGYATCLAVAAWFAIDCLFSIRQDGFKHLLKSFFKKTSFVALISVFVFASLALFTNIYSEAKKRDVSLSETSIVITAKHRTGMTDAYNVPWLSFTQGQASRIFKGALPFPLNAIRKYEDFGPGGEYLHKEGKLTLTLILTLVAYLTLLFLVLSSVWKSRHQFKVELSSLLTKTNIVIALSGFAWMFPMKRLAGAHHYTNMYYIGFYVIVGVFFWTFLKDRKKIKLALIASFAIFTLSLINVQAFYNASEKFEPNYTQDFDVIRESLELKEISKLSVDRNFSEYVKGSPYSLCFYIGDRYISDENKFIITDKKEMEGYTNLTPENTFYYLLESNLTM